MLTFGGNILRSEISKEVKYKKKTRIVEIKQDWTRIANQLNPRVSFLPCPSEVAFGDALFQSRKELKSSFAFYPLFALYSIIRGKLRDRGQS